MTHIEHGAKKRAADFSFWVRVSETLEKYKLLAWIALLVLLAMGFDYKTPAQSFREIRDTLASQKVRIDTLYSRDNEQTRLMKNANEKVGQLIEFQCLSASPRERITLKCGDPR